MLKEQDDIENARIRRTSVFQDQNNTKQSSGKQHGKESGKYTKQGKDKDMNIVESSGMSLKELKQSNTGSRKSIDVVQPFTMITDTDSNILESGGMSLKELKHKASKQKCEDVV